MKAKNKHNQNKMPKQSRDDYLKALVIKNKYHSLSKKQKGTILDEYCKNTGLERNYVIKKIKKGDFLIPKEERKRKRKRRRASKYDDEVKASLVEIWRIYDYPCGERLKSSLETGVDKLRSENELQCSDRVANLLKEISPRTIDEKLKDIKEKELINRKYHAKQLDKPLYHSIPIKTAADQIKFIPGFTQMDFVEHCGGSLSGAFIHTLDLSDLFSGWTELEALPNKSQLATSKGLNNILNRLPFLTSEIHSDNDTSFINYHLYRITKKSKIKFSRSRPYKKNDNFLAEQKNWTHVRKLVGYLRYDTNEELNILNDLYRNELRLYKNFFQPHIKLIKKERVNGRIKRKYDKPKTPYHLLMESKYISERTKLELTEVYDSLNPAELKRNIDKKIRLLVKAYQKKQNSKSCQPMKHVKPSMNSNLNEISLSFLNCRS